MFMKNSKKSERFWSKTRGHMADNNSRVRPMKEIRLAYSAGSAPGRDDLVPGPEAVCFVYGIGINGLTPFESALEGKAVGEEVAVRLEAEDVPEVFGHLLHEMGALPIRHRAFYLNLRIAGVSDADQRRLIQALAATTSCGGDCGCGCGGH
jgi:hypothetical protein